MKAIDAANYLVYLMSDVCDDLTNMKLNKLLYYAQGHYLQQYGAPMFSDSIEAWNHGPVIPDVYAHYKSNENAPITEYDLCRAEAFPSPAADVLFEVAREYGRYTASALRNMTHIPNGPWDQAYRSGGRHIEIPVSSIRDYFNRPHIKRLSPLELHFTEEDFVGYHDASGALVLPKEWNDEEV